jgi:Uma2 family endonuclease
MNAVLPLTRHKVSVEDYHRMGDAGVFAPDSRVELILGEMFDMARIDSVHASVVSRLSMFFSRSVGTAAWVSTQNPIRLLPDSEPQPDVAVLKPRADYYRNMLPVAADVLLLIEVADSSLEYDREVKLSLYASHGIPEVWLVDLRNQRVEVYTGPHGSDYANRRRLHRGEALIPQLVAVPPFDLSEIFI